MTDPELVRYITEQTQEGVGADTLRQTLMESGWRQADIDNALHDVAAGLHPTTPGVSIHADLAQVRGMVAHLAGRVRVLEAKLAGEMLLPMQQELPAPRHAIWLRHVTALLVGLGTFFALDRSGNSLVARNALAPIDQAVILAGAGAVLLIGGYVFIRLHRGWIASLVTDIGVATGAVAVWAAYRGQYIEWSTTLALAILLGVLLIVMERWTDRLMR